MEGNQRCARTDKQNASSFTALLAFEYVLTFHGEVALFWTRGRLSGATILFLLNRYLTLTVQIMDVVPKSSSTEVCISTSSIAFSQYVAYIVLKSLQYLPWAAFSALRSYALCPHPYRWPVSATVFALSSVPIITNMFGNLHRISIVNDSQLGIIVNTPISASTALKRDMTVAVATQSSLIGSDLMVLCVTWFRTYETAKLSLRSLGKETFASVLLLDGTVHSRCIPLPDSHSDAVSSLTAIFTSRFLIDLQRTQRELAGSSRSVSLGEVVFQPQTSRNTSRLIGSLGAQLSFHEGVDREDEVEDAM
ncbi:hypothetical protein BD309DRAFT_878676 [Dichomitus squalens]|nr:hypothetical protein BD309DRAFT_878676 [Dichomitus squalens]